MYIRNLEQISKRSSTGAVINTNVDCRHSNLEPAYVESISLEEMPEQVAYSLQDGDEEGMTRVSRSNHGFTGSLKLLDKDFRTDITYSSATLK